MCSLKSQSIASTIATLDFRDPGCMEQIAFLRADLEDELSAHNLTKSEWRQLWEEVSVVQARCSALQPDAWRYRIKEFSNIEKSAELQE
jgi:hypothetical protein